MNAVAAPGKANQAAEPDTPLEQATISMAIEHILLNLFRKFQGTRPDMEQRLQTAFKKKYGREMMSQAGGRDVRAIYLEGEPGHGKTTAHRLACKKFCELMDLKFMVNPTIRQMREGKIDANSFVFTTMTIAGAQSKHEIGGLMAKVKVGDHEFMGHLPDWKLAASMMGAFGYVLFDDFTAAGAQTQNATLDLLLDGAAGDMQFNMKEVAAGDLSLDKSGQLLIEVDPAKEAAIDKMTPEFRGAGTVQVGLAANRGKRDGNNSLVPLTTALASRVERMDVKDTVPDWNERAIARHVDELSDCFYSTFLRQNPEIFSIVGQQIHNITTQQPNPRTHDACMDLVRTYAHMRGGLEQLGKDKDARDRFLGEIHSAAGRTIGHMVQQSTPSGPVTHNPSEKLRSFFSELLLGTYPKAEQIMKTGEVDETFLKEKINGGNDGEGVNFSYQFASTLGTLAAAEFAQKFNEVLEEKKLSLKDALVGLESSKHDSPAAVAIRRVMSRYSYGLCLVNQSMMTFSINKFYTRLAAIAPDLFEGADNYKNLHLQFIQPMMIGLVHDNDKFPAEAKERHKAFADVISKTTSTAEFFGEDATIKEGVAKRRQALASAKKAAASATAP